MNPWVAINERLDRVAVKLRRRLADLERLGPILLGLLAMQERQRAAKKGSFFNSRAARDLRVKHASPARHVSACGCHVNGTRVRKMSGCSVCRNKAVIVCRLDHSGAVRCKSAEGVQFFRDEQTFRDWAAQRGLEVEG